MTDSVAVFPSGYRLTDSDTGAPMEGATIEFYDAGTTTPRTVYSDADLSTPIGTVVTTNALGYPTTNGATQTLVYTDTASYKIIIKNFDGVTVAEHDNVKGATTSLNPASLTINSFKPISVKSLAYTIVSADQNKIIVANCSGGSFTLTLPNAIDVANGWAITVQHAGSANKVSVAAVSSQTITHGVTSLGTSVDLRFTGEEITFVSDGGNWKASPRIQQFVPAGTIMMHAATTAPLGWFSCDGSTISRTTYAALFAAIGTVFGAGDGSTTFAIPDLRGYFVRGLGTNADGTASGTIGVKTADTFKAHDHSSLTTNGPRCYSQGAIGTEVNVSGLGSVLNHESGGHTASSSTAFGRNGPVFIPSEGGTETRPKNIALLHIIKY